MNEQGTEEWFNDRLGKVTASRIADIVAKTKTGESASREKYMLQLLAERVTNVREPTFLNTAMQWGTDQEPVAKLSYQIETGKTVVNVGFIPHPNIAMSGASPDGLVDDDGLVEIKCPNTSTHLQFLINQKIPKSHYDQMQWQMSCTNRKWCDYISFDPRVQANIQLEIIRIERNEVYIQELEFNVGKFLDELLHMEINLLNKDAP